MRKENKNVQNPYLKNPCGMVYGSETGFASVSSYDGSTDSAYEYGGHFASDKGNATAFEIEALGTSCLDTTVPVVAAARRARRSSREYVTPKKSSIISVWSLSPSAPLAV